MDSLYLLIPVALIFCAIAIRLLIWAIDSGQYDDLDKDAWRILAEDAPDASQPADDDAGSEAQVEPRTEPVSEAKNSREKHREQSAGINDEQ